MTFQSPPQNFQDPVLEYYSLDDFGLFDNEEAFWELCDSLDFQPSSSDQSRDDASQVGAKRRRGSEDYDARMPPSLDKKPTTKDPSPSNKVETKTVTPTAQSSPSRNNNSNSQSQTSLVENYAASEIDSAKAVHAKESEDPKNARKPVCEVNPFVTIPANDIRRQYALMFAEAIGSNDGDQLAKILQTHCTEDAVLIFKYKGKTSPYGPTFLEVIGKHAIVVFWPQGIATVPDMLFELLSTNIKVLSNGYCSIITKCKLVGTKVIELAVDSKDSVVLVSDPTLLDPSTANSNKELYRHQGDGVLAIAIESEENPQVIPNQVPEDTLVTKVNRTGVKMNMIATITYYVDPNKQIYRIEFIHAMQHEKEKASSKTK